MGKSSSAVTCDLALLDHVTYDVASLAAVHTERVADEEVDRNPLLSEASLSATGTMSQEAFAHICEHCLAPRSFSTSTNSNSSSQSPNAINSRVTSNTRGLASLQRVFNTG